MQRNRDVRLAEYGRVSANVLDACRVAGTAEGEQHTEEWMSEQWKGIGKLVEECGEVLQLCGKAIPFPTGDHPDGLGSIDRRMELELGDLLAAIEYVMGENGLDGEMIHARKAHKLYKFKEWGLTGISARRYFA